MRRIVLITAMLALAGGAPLRAEDDPLKQALALEGAIQRVIEKAEPSVACILVSRSEEYSKFNALSPRGEKERGKLGDFVAPEYDAFRQDADTARKRELLKRLNLAAPQAVPDSYGSGIVIDPKLVLTNQHVVRDATKIFVRVPGGGSYANIRAWDERSDLAVLELIHAPLGQKPLAAGDGDSVKKGQFALALANPWAAGFRDGSASVAFGMISNVRRRLPGEPNEGEKRRPRLHYYPTLPQTTINIRPGSSGGALLDIKGNWIGLLTALPGVTGAENSGGYAIPLDTRMKRIIDTLKEGKEVEYGFLGISQSSDFRGSTSWSPTHGGPAARAGMVDGDIIRSINGTPILDIDDLMFNIAASLAGTQISLVVERNQQLKELRPVLVKTSWPSNSPVIATNRPVPVHGLRVDYTSVLFQGQDRSIPGGVLVREVEEGSPAAKANLQPDRDLITEVNGLSVDTPAEFYREVRKTRGDLELTVREKDGPARRVKLP